jgi:hypothetical protein
MISPQEDGTRTAVRKQIDGKSLEFSAFYKAIALAIRKA